jgi:hypothetical protein
MLFDRSEASRPLAKLQEYIRRFQHTHKAGRRQYQCPNSCAPIKKVHKMAPVKVQLLSQGESTSTVGAILLLVFI